MTRGKGRHLGKESREVIERGVRNGDSARKISKAIGVSASTVTREVRTNRTVRETRARPGAKASPKCARYGECGKVGGACESFATCW